MRPPLDTGVSLRTPGDRLERARATRRRTRVQLIVVGFALLIALIVGWRVSRPSADSATAQANAAATKAVAGVEAGTGDPTPFFAAYGDLELYLPVPVTSLTEIGFHQASGDKALHMVSLLPDADMTKAAKDHGTGRVVQAVNGKDVLTGSVLRMWRSNRSGKPDSAADIGALAGTTVFAPVTGTVVQVRPYKLYEKYDDYEIHIKPNGIDDVDVVLIHVDDVRIAEGDRVIGGVTPLAVVRMLSDRVTPQISAYTSDPGDHVHVQLNKIAEAGSLENPGGS